MQVLFSKFTLKCSKKHKNLFNWCVILTQKFAKMTKMKQKVLLVNPPIYDFSAYDFWLKPYGLLRAGGYLGDGCSLFLYDYLDRLSSDIVTNEAAKPDPWGRGPYPKAVQTKPISFAKVPRYFYRFGRNRFDFQNFLQATGPFDAVLIQTVMTYWYPGYTEVIEDIRRFSPQAKIVLGGFYATCCPGHAKGLGADLVIAGDELGSIFELLGAGPRPGAALPVWELYPRLKTGVIKLTQGCPFRCSYCYVPQSGVRFSTRPVADCIAELEHLVRLGTQDIAFYDDALLYRPEEVLFPFLEEVIRRGIGVNFHTPNALHARFLTAQAAELMVRAGFKTFYLGFESRSEAFHSRTGAKVICEELAEAVGHLRQAGADMRQVTAYEILGHPQFEAQQLEASMRFAAGLGIRVMLSDFSPILGTPDGELCREIVDLDEPLNHNKTAFPILSLGVKTVNYYKNLCRQLNRRG